jgi:serine phosphatase RsbU (regulator of sigma subunit)
VRDPRKVAALVAAACLVLTALATWSTARVDANSERRLLERQTRQAAAVLSTAIVVIQAPMSTALSVEAVAGPAGDRRAFSQFMASYVGPDRLFVSASLWRRHGDQVTRLAATGAAPAQEPGPTAQVLRSFDTRSATTRQVSAGQQLRIAWALADPRTDLAVYAERAIPSDRRTPVDSNSAYANLHYAIYLGKEISDAALSTTDADPDSLPLTGLTAREHVDFGDSELTVVTTPRGHLGSSLSHWLPLGLLLGGLLITAIATLATLRLARGRRDAEDGAATITTLYQQVETLYDQQRDLFERLQWALLPRALPRMPGLETASQYVAGARGTDIGGDWFSFVALDEHRFGFVVGDVSGRGVDTVAVMAQARFTIRAYLLDGDEPATALEKCSRQFDITTDGHLTTVITGVGDARTGELTLANAGHPTPLLLDGGVRAVEVPPGRPLGTGPSGYQQRTITLEPGATLFCFTDGLVERRGEDIDTGTARLAATLAGAAGRSVDELVAHAVSVLRTDDAADDIAALAIRRVGIR